ncbi:NUDIX domain-containing protein [Actinoplanes sp. NPDC049681]|uniref:NUDIX domain-containing protein n=1 Tax=Actinoplanes sp. NPDC049681 TaxID=3363905 RepID=UPI0037A1A7D9
MPPDFWLLAGGGVRPGETFEQAAHREVVEETGLTGATIGRCVWTQEKLITDPSGELQLVEARFFLGRITSPPPVSFAGHEPYETATIRGWRWFRHHEIVAREREETFLPPGLGGLLADVLDGTAGDPVPLIGGR